MSNTFQSVRGTEDVLPDNVHIWQNVEKLFYEISSKYGFSEIRVPTFEYTELFLRNVGDDTDIVEKEMYTFLDKSNRSLTLKPEGTAGVVRSVIQHSLLNRILPLKLFYITPCFRYDKPQSGRLREFHQFGIESFGGTNCLSDIEVILLANDIFSSLGLSEYIDLEINSIGCKECRPFYNKKMKDFLLQNQDEFCVDCQKRMINNPLRVFDCKVGSCKSLIENAPKINENLCDDCDSHFNSLKQNLDELNVEYKINEKIVRGLDYYTKTVFEFVTDKIGAQSTVCGGGRYDYLIENMGHKPVSGVGFALGIERLILLLESTQNNILKTDFLDLFVCCVSKDEYNFCLKLLQKLRKQNIKCSMDLMDKSLKAQMKFADKINAKYTCIIGSDERKSGIVKIKNMINKEERQSSFDDILNILKEEF